MGLVAADLVIVTALGAATVLTWRLVREERVRVALHWSAGVAASVVLLLVAGAFLLEPKGIVRACFVAAFLIVTAPLSTSAMADVGRREEERRRRGGDDRG